MTSTFRTEIAISPSKSKIEIDSSIISMGSCFAENIVEHLQQNKINASKDPLGIAFNPISISKRISFALDNRQFDESQSVFNEGVAFHLQAHSTINGTTQNELYDKVVRHQKDTQSLLKNCDILILTLGTSFVHEHLESKEIVANCHKQNTNHFSKRLLDLEEIIQSLSAAFEKLKAQNPVLKVILTVSPIRHTREGLSENNLSKSILKIACHQMAVRFEAVSYFPSYEIMMDDLRSYQFYEADLIHPNNLAKQYIFKLFEETYYSEELKNHIEKWKNISKRMAHKALHPASKAHQAFLKKLLADLKTYSYPFDLSNEIALTQSKIGSIDNLKE